MMRTGFEVQEPKPASHAGDSEDVALARQAVRLGERVKDLGHRQDRHMLAMPIGESATRAQRRALERWGLKSEKFETEIQRYAGELSQLRELQTDRWRRDPEVRATEVTFNCGKCDRSITTTQGDVLDGARVICPSCGDGIRLATRVTCG